MISTFYLSGNKFTYIFFIFFLEVTNQKNMYFCSVLVNYYTKNNTEML